MGFQVERESERVEGRAAVRGFQVGRESERVEGWLAVREWSHLQAAAFALKGMDSYKLALGRWNVLPSEVEYPLVYAL